MLLENCPYCNTKHVHAAEHYTINFDDKTSWTLASCQNKACGKVILVIRYKNGSIAAIYPSGSFDLDETIDIDIEIRNDYKEAGLCLSAGCYKASMVMSRRALQRCLKEQGCNQRNLVDALDHAIKSGILRKSFHEIATEIRQYGNLSAHPDDDQLSNITKENAQLILNFVQILISDFYEIPAAAKKLRINRQAPNASE